MIADDPRYPVGRFHREGVLDEGRRNELIAEIAALPERLREALVGIGEEELSTPYRDGGWTLRQVVHHVADSHINAYVRFRLALTEERPTIKPYLEALWAELPDTALTPPQASVALLEALHLRWVAMLRALPEPAFRRELYHPEQERAISLDEMVALYAWHGRHHLGHILAARRLARQREPGAV
jgi:uncharacterized damage-inducible protein DinB